MELITHMTKVVGQFIGKGNNFPYPFQRPIPWKRVHTACADGLDLGVNTRSFPDQALDTRFGIVVGLRSQLRQLLNDQRKPAFCGNRSLLCQAVDETNRLYRRSAKFIYLFAGAGFVGTFQVPVRQPLMKVVLRSLWKIAAFRAHGTQVSTDALIQNGTRKAPLSLEEVCM